jgi:hypothetical protein
MAKRYEPLGKLTAAYPAAVKAVAHVTHVVASCDSLCMVTDPPPKVAETVMPYWPPRRVKAEVVTEMLLKGTSSTVLYISASPLEGWECGEDCTTGKDTFKCLKGNLYILAGQGDTLTIHVGNAKLDVIAGRG